MENENDKDHLGHPWAQISEAGHSIEVAPPVDLVLMGAPLLCATLKQKGTNWSLILF